MKLTGMKQEEVDADNLKKQGDAVREKRRSWHLTIGNPTFFDEQLGDIPKGVWKAAVLTMKDDNPYPNGYIKGG